MLATDGVGVQLANSEVPGQRFKTNDKEPNDSAGTENMKELRQSRVLRFLFAGLLAGVLAACGGGGGGSDPGFIGGGIDDPGTGDPGTGDPGVGDSGTLTIELTDTDGNPTNTISNTEPGIITLTYVDSSGNPGADALVSVTSTVGAIDPPTGLTNENGIANFVLEANNQSGAGTVTATIEDLVASVNFQISAPSQGNNVLALQLTDAGGNPVTNITSISPGILTVTAEDPFGQPIADEVISATATLGTISPGPGQH